MTWLKHHKESERLAGYAEVAVNLGRKLYAQAAIAEERALLDLDPSKLRTASITKDSIAALKCKAGHKNQEDVT